MKRKIYAVLLVGALLLGAFSLSACAKKLEKYSDTAFGMFDTLTMIIGFDTSEDSFKEKTAILFDELEIYHELYDIYHNYDGVANLKTINDNAGIQPVQVDERIIDMLEYAKEMYELTEGQTNVVMGSVLRIWHNCRSAASDDPSSAALPSQEELEAAAQHMALESLVIDREKSTVYLSDPESRLDVGAIAKGYATDRLADIAKENGWTNMALSVGGNIKTIGPKADGETWKVGIQTPDSSWGKSYFCLVELQDLSLVTSGSYQRYFEVEGERYHHIINPETLWPVNHFLSVSIICESSAMADALSTALFNISQEEGQKLIDSLAGVEAVWVYPDGEYVYTAGLEHILE